MTKILIFDEHPCHCDQCIEMCKTYSCLPTPEEATALIRAGYGKQLMLDTRPSVSKPHIKILTLLPAMKGYERMISPMEIGISPCIFLNDKGLCDLHEKGLKPFEGRTVQHNTNKTTEQAILNLLKSMWNTKSGHSVVIEWISEYYLGDPKWVTRNNYLGDPKWVTRNKIPEKKE